MRQKINDGEYKKIVMNGHTLLYPTSIESEIMKLTGSRSEETKSIAS